MKIELSYSLSEIQYNEAIIVQNSSLQKNSVLSVIFSSSEILLGSIDFTALPHFHRYTVMEWKEALNTFFKENEISLDTLMIKKPFFNMPLTQVPELDGEIMFVIESVLFSIIEKISPESLSFIQNRTIKCNRLYSEGLNDFPDCLKIKIKPTPKSLEKTKTIVNYLLQKKPGIRLRLDGNRSFNVNELKEYMEEVQAFAGPHFFQAVDYLEEPLKNHDEYREFSRVHPYPEALDETLIELIKNKNDLSSIPRGTYLVLKPSLVGLSKSLLLLEKASEYDYKVVISSSYETHSSIRPLMFLAASNPGTYHGLDTLKFLPKNLGNPSTDFTLLF